MKLRKILKAFALGGAAVAVALSASNAYAQKRVKWKM